MNSFKMLHSYKQSIWNSIINIRAAKTYQMQIVHTLRSSSQQMSKVDVENSLNVTSNLCFPFVICQGACQRIPKLDAVPTYPLADFFASIVQSPPESMSFFLLLLLLDFNFLRSFRVCICTGRSNEQSPFSHLFQANHHRSLSYLLPSTLLFSRMKTYNLTVLYIKFSPLSLCCPSPNLCHISILLFPAHFL